MLKLCIIYLFILPMLVLQACAKDDPTDRSSGTENEGPPVEQQDPDSDSEPGQRGLQIVLADPTIFYDQDSQMYYLYGTGKVNQGFQVYSSADLSDWVSHTQLALSKADTYGNGGFWAPQVFKKGKKYYMAYTADEHIAIAQSDSPLGPFTQQIQKPLTDPDGFGNIDPYVFTGPDGKVYLYYVRLTGGNRLFMATLKADLSDIEPSSVVSCINAVDHAQDWEHTQGAARITEGPTILLHKDLYYFFYSANDFRNIDYAVGYATAMQPAGPWTKYPHNPILDRRLIGKNGSGHGDFFTDAKGAYWYVFHTHYSNEEVNPRRTALIKGRFESQASGPDVFVFDPETFTYLSTAP